MATAFQPQFSFTAGQVDEALEQRGDLEMYYKALKKAENCFINITGGVDRRYGTKYLNVAPPGNAFRIIDYTARANNVDYTNIIVFGENVADVYNVSSCKYLGRFNTGKSATLMSQCDYETDGNRILFVHETVKPFQIVYSGGSGSSLGNFQVSDIVFENIPYYEFSVNDDTNATYGTLTPSGTSGYITLTASSGTPFNADLVGKKISISPVGIVRINKFVSGTVVKGFVEKALQDTEAIPAGSWTIEKGWEPIMSATKGYPRTLAFYAGRLYFGGTTALPNLLLASTIEDNYDFDLGDASDSDGFYEFTDSKDASHIYMLQSRNTLEIYCNESVYVISTTGPITPTSIKATRVSPTGIMPYTDAPLIADGGSLYINNDKSGVYWMIYNFDNQTYLCDLISELASTMVSAAAPPVTYQTTVWKGDKKHRNNFFAFVDEEQNIVFVSLLLREKVKAFSKMIIQERATDHQIHKMPVVCIYASKDRFFIIAKSETKNSHYLFVLDSDSYLDNSGVYTVQNKQIEGLDRYNNTVVDVIFLKTGLHATANVSENKMDFTRNVYVENGDKLEIGYPYYITLETMPVEDVQNLGSSIGKDKKINMLFVNPKEISNMTINGSKRIYTTNNEPQVRPFVERALINLGWDKNRTIRLSQREPMKFGIKNMLARVEVHD